MSEQWGMGEGNGAEAYWRWHPQIFLLAYLVQGECGETGSREMPRF
jgi:hypothetical protein